MARIRRAAVILNPSSGPKRSGDPASDVRTALNSAGVAEVEVVLLLPGLDVKAVVTERARNGTDVIVAAGGDGTISAVAGALAGTDTALGVLPAGTLNHFAKDLGIPADLAEAARVIADGKSVCVDVAKVNGRVFVNNSSIGIYPAMVAVREYLTRRGLGKRLATAVGSVAALWEFPNTVLRLSTQENGVLTRTPFVFVGNNEYRIAGLQAGTRERVNCGVLQVATVRNPSRIALFRTLVSAVAGNTDAAPELHIENAETARVATLRHHVPVAVDGEVIAMHSPLVYSIWPGALWVLVPNPA